MTLIDTHAHLYLPEFDEDRTEVVQRAKDVGVDKVLLPNIDSSTTKWMHDMVSKYPKMCIPMMGLHPCSVKSDTYQSELNHVGDFLKKGDYIAVGEIGMDLHWDKTTKDIQEEAFTVQCKWAVEMDLPVAIHSRNATRELIDVLQKLKLKNLRGVFHCFGDGIEEANDIIDLGFYLGIGGVATFKNSGLSPVLEQVDLKHIILETDSPYLAPVPNRGKRNESSYVKLVAQKMAEIHDLDFKQIADITTSNARELFRIT
jgi:TatD DNase family protein